MKETNLPVIYDDILNASSRLKGFAHRTPVFISSQANEKTGAQIFFKCENFQRIGAFKFRGAYNAISQLSETQKQKGIVAFSSGNHAQAVALAARLLNVPATIVMPTDAPSVKLAATRGYGANIVLYDRNNASREEIAANLVNQYGLALIPPYDHPDIIAGQGTAAKELLEEVGTLDYLFVPVGGGGLISGSAISAAHLSPHCIVIGVEPEAGNDAQQSLRTQKIVKIAVPNTIADGAQTQFVGKFVLPILIRYVKDIVTVSDNQLREQMRFFAERMKMIVEPTGCLGAAAIFNKIVDVQGARVGVILSGGNVDMNKFCDCVRSAS